MAKLTFQKATKEQAKLRLAIFGPSGSGKTYSALRIATGLGGKIALIDTERGRASKYADRFAFDVLELPQRDISTYCVGIAAAGGYDVLIIDSLTHAWHELLTEVDKLAKTKYRGNTWSAWSEGTPKQRQLVDTLLAHSGHVIATMRSKTEWTTETDPRTGKTKPVRVGLSPEQGKGIEYEFDLLMELSTEHVANVIKDDTGKYQDQYIEKPDEALGVALAAWLLDGKPVEKKDPPKDPAEGKKETGTEPVSRPYAPEEVKRGLVSRAAKGSADPAISNLKGAVVGALNGLFSHETKIVQNGKRHGLLKWWPGVDSSNKLTDGQCRAYLAWATEKDPDGDGWLPSGIAIQEAVKIIESLDLPAAGRPT